MLQLLNVCKNGNIHRVAFPKYAFGLDKLEWKFVSECMNKILIDNDIECVIYLDIPVTNEIIESHMVLRDFPLRDQIKRLKECDKNIIKLKRKIMNKKLKGFTIKNGVIT